MECSIPCMNAFTTHLHFLVPPTSAQPPTTLAPIRKHCCHTTANNYNTNPPPFHWARGLFPYNARALVASTSTTLPALKVTQSGSRVAKRNIPCPSLDGVSDLGNSADCPSLNVLIYKLATTYNPLKTKSFSLMNNFPKLYDSAKGHFHHNYDRNPTTHVEDGGWCNNGVQKPYLYCHGNWKYLDIHLNLDEFHHGYNNANCKLF